MVPQSIPHNVIPAQAQGRWFLVGNTQINTGYSRNLQAVGCGGALVHFASFWFLEELGGGFPRALHATDFGKVCPQGSLQ